MFQNILRNLERIEEEEANANANANGWSAYLVSQGKFQVEPELRHRGMYVLFVKKRNSWQY